MGNICLPKACSSKQWLKRVHRAIGLNFIFHKMLSIHDCARSAACFQARDESDPAAYHFTDFTHDCLRFFAIISGTCLLHVASFKAIGPLWCMVKSLKIMSHLKSKHLQLITKNKDLHQELFTFLQVTQYNATVFHCDQQCMFPVCSALVCFWGCEDRKGEGNVRDEDEEEFAHEGLKMMRERQLNREIFACISLIGYRGSVLLWHLLLIFADNKSGLFPHWLFFTELFFSLCLSLCLFLSFFSWCSFFLPVFEGTWVILKALFLL